MSRKNAIVFSLVTVVLLLSSCIKRGYICVQQVNIGGAEIEVSRIDFNTRKQFDDFRADNDTVNVNDSTFLYWDCLIAE